MTRLVTPVTDGNTVARAVFSFATRDVGSIGGRSATKFFTKKSMATPDARRRTLKS